MAITFPTNPSDGQTTLVGQTAYIYNATTGVWDASQSPVIISASAPSSAAEGVFWWNSTTGGMYIRYDGQWITAGNGADGLDGAAGADATVSYANTSSFPTSGNTAGDLAYAEDVSKLYIWSGSAWEHIATTNTGPNIIQGGAGTYKLATDGTPTVITLSATDPEGLPITWSYAVTSGSLGSTATVSQADNVFTITPSTDQNDAGTFQLTFTASDGVYTTNDVNTFNLTWNTTVDYLLVGGGGGGGTDGGGAGGAGAYLVSTEALSLLSGTFSVVVGAGGAGSNPANGHTNGFNGSASTLTLPDSTSLTAEGGGGGGHYTTGTGTSGNSGGCGGGGGVGGTTGGSGGTGVGNVSGTGWQKYGNGGGAAYSGAGGAGAGAGGGGGAGASGGNGGGTYGGVGGAGLQWIDGNYYAGGGGGNSDDSSTVQSAGGQGGGGQGGIRGTTAASDGTANTGGGGGGGPHSALAGSGGSGVCILRADGQASATTGTVTETQSGGYYWYTFTDDGTITF